MVSALVQLLEEVRTIGGLKGSDVANMARVSPATVSRWTHGQAVPHPQTQMRISDLRYVADRLSEFYGPQEIRLWLYAKHPLLEGQRPIDLIFDGKAEAVLDVIERLDAGVYL